MNNSTINSELARALRRCLPFVRICRGLGYDTDDTVGTALRALVDHDARRMQEEAVNNIIEAESDYRRVSINAAEGKTQAARAVRPGEGYLPAAPPVYKCTCETCTTARKSSWYYE